MLDQAEAFVFQNLEHLEELMKLINRTPKKLQDLNDISRIKELYTGTVKGGGGSSSEKLPKLVR